MTSIKWGTLSTCPALTSVTIPASVTSIEGYAFVDSPALAEMRVEATVPPAIDGEFPVFDDVDKSIPVYVPTGSIEAYRMAEYWDEFTNFQPIEGSGIAAPSPAESITVQGGEVHINMAGIDAVQVYDLQGHQVLRTTERCFALPQGIYIIKVGDEAVKVSL